MLITVEGPDAANLAPVPPMLRRCNGECGPAASAKPESQGLKGRIGTGGSLIHMLPGMIGTPDEWTGLDVAEAYRHRRRL
jgi:hypothetical protein